MNEVHDSNALASPRRRRQLVAAAAVVVLSVPLLAARAEESGTLTLNW